MLGTCIQALAVLGQLGKAMRRKVLNRSLKEPGNGDHFPGFPRCRPPRSSYRHSPCGWPNRDSAELKRLRKLVRIRPKIVDFEPDLGLKLGRTKPKISGTVPTNRHTTIPSDSEPISACSDDDPNLFNCEVAQPRLIRGYPQLSNCAFQI